MPKPVRGDSGYYEQVSNSSDEELEAPSSPKKLQFPVDPGPDSDEDEQTTDSLKRKSSIYSLVSSASRGSSKLYDDFPEVDDEEWGKLMDEGKQQFTQLSIEESPDPIRLSCESTEGDSPRKRKLSESVTPQKQRPFRVESPDFQTPKAKTDRRAPTCQTPTSHLREDQGEIAVVSHSNAYQGYFDKHLPWGAQWEIARLVSIGKLKYDDISLDSLRPFLGASNGLAARKMESILYASNANAGGHQANHEALVRDLSVKNPWNELDMEEQRLSENLLHGIGSHEEFYGGKITFALRLVRKEAAGLGNDAYSLELCRPELGTSTRIARRWGSWRILRVRIPQDILKQKGNGLLPFFRRDFIIHGRVFRPFHAKENTVFMFQLDKIYKGGEIYTDPSNEKISFQEFLQWNNPMHLNSGQSLAKWCARMDLGLSNSVPGLLLKRENIIEIKDEYSEAGLKAIEQGRKPESKDVMTDGSGFCSQTILLYLRNKFGWNNVPCAIQYRLFGTKGLLVLHPDDMGFADAPHRVWLRDSQKKVNYDDDNLDPSHLVLEVLRPAQLKTPARLSTQIIINLAQNGVPYKVFLDLMKDGLQEIAASLTQWTGTFAMENLWRTVCKVNGSVIRSRMAKEAGGVSRLMGFSIRDWGNNEGENPADDIDEAVLGDQSKNAQTEDDGGSLEESVMIMLDSGFQPQSCPNLAMKIKEVLKKALNLYIEQYKIVVPRSAEAWIIPDPCGVLAPDEIFFKTSEPIMGPDGINRDHLLGDVLVTRHPCCVPSDIQKVQAVWKNELRRYCDVIVFPVKGTRSLASMLGGGDYDGDTGHIIWEPSVVESFKVPDSKFADPPEKFDEAFEQNTMTVAEFLKSDQNSTLGLSHYTLSALNDSSLIGQYFTFYEVAVYKFGYESSEAWRLAYMFCAVLDSRKTGKRVQGEVLKKDRSTYNNEKTLPYKKSLIDEGPGSPWGPQAEVKRLDGVKDVKFIMDRLKADGKKQYDHHMGEFEGFLNASQIAYKESLGIKMFVDSSLEAPWLDAERRATILASQGQDQLANELYTIERHVDDILTRYTNAPKDLRLTTPKKNTASSKKVADEIRRKHYRDLSNDFNGGPQGAAFLALSNEEVKRLKASYAYVAEVKVCKKRSYLEKYPRFAFDVAMRELCMIKSRSLGTAKMVTSGFYSVFNVSSSVQAFRPQDPMPYPKPSGF
ncbi:hypothetical protein M422DRAFT_205121 [Sphaerobolus stellatus SS14]|nr:hypothetical protein M422DRAFT_205121 [Sphaerobolus stellatus SS14]